MVCASRARRSSDGVAPVVWQRVPLSPNVPPRVLWLLSEGPYSTHNAGLLAHHVVCLGLVLVSLLGSDVSAFCACVTSLESGRSWAPVAVSRIAHCCHFPWMTASNVISASFGVWYCALRTWAWRRGRSSRSPAPAVCGAPSERAVPELDPKDDSVAHSSHRRRRPARCAFHPARRGTSARWAAAGRPSGRERRSELVRVRVRQLELVRARPAGALALRGPTRRQRHRKRSITRRRVWGSLSRAHDAREEPYHTKHYKAQHKQPCLNAW